MARLLRTFPGRTTRVLPAGRGVLSACVFQGDAFQNDAFQVCVVAVVATPRPRIRTRVVSELAARQIRSIGRFARLGDVAGRPTRKPPVRPARVVDQALVRRTVLARTKTRSLRTRPFGSPYRVHRPYPIFVVRAGEKRVVLLPRLKTRGKFVPKFGAATRTPPVRRPRVATLRLRRPSHYAYQSGATHVFGRSTSRPKPRPIERVLVQRERHRRIHSFLRRAAGGIVVPPSPRTRPLPIRSVFVTRERHRRVHSFLRRAGGGVATARAFFLIGPPDRPIFNKKDFVRINPQLILLKNGRVARKLTTKVYLEL